MQINDNLSNGDVDELFKDGQHDDLENDTDAALLKKL